MGYSTFTPNVNIPNLNDSESELCHIIHNVGLSPNVLRHTSRL